MAWPHSLNIFSRFSYVVACSLHFYLFSWLNDIPLHVHSIFIHLYIYMLWTFGLFLLFGCYEKCCYEHMCMCICLNTCFQSFFLGMKLVGHMAILCLTFWGTAKWFSQQLNHFIFSPAMHRVPISPGSNQNLLFYFNLKPTVLGLNWHHSRVLICIPIQTNDAEHLSCVIGYFYVFFGEMTT